MASALPAPATSALDPTVALRLQTHLIRSHHGDKEAWILGTLEQLRVATKISHSEEVAKCFAADGIPISYPQLAERNYLVACIEDKDAAFNTEVIAVYSKKQMQEIYASCRNDREIDNIQWCVLEISAELETDLLINVDLATRTIYTTPQAFFKLWAVQEE